VNSTDKGKGRTGGGGENLLVVDLMATEIGSGAEYSHSPRIERQTTTTGYEERNKDIRESGGRTAEKKGKTE